MTDSGKVVNDAIDLEKNSKYFEAFVKYLEATASLCLDIIEKCKSYPEESGSEKTLKRLKTIGCCVDRVKAVQEILAPSKVPASEQHPEVTPRRSNAATLDPESRAKEVNRQLIMRHRESVSRKDYTPAERAAAETSLQKKMLENIALAEQETQKTLRSQFSPTGQKIPGKRYSTSKRTIYLLRAASRSKMAHNALCHYFKKLTFPERQDLFQILPGRSTNPNNGDQLFGFNTLRKSLRNNSEIYSNSRGQQGFEPATVSYLPQHIDVDSDIEAGPQLPKLTDLYDQQFVDSLNSKESTRQKGIAEFIHTERTHVGHLKILNKIFYQPLKRHSILPENFVQFSPCTLFHLIFPNLDEVLEIHCQMNNTFKKLLRQRRPIENFADVLLKFFDREVGENFRNTVIQFCQHQQYAVELIEERRNQDPKFNAFLLETQNHPLCKNFTLGDRLLKEMQRITKYPLLIDLIIKNTNEEDAEEIQKLGRCLECAKKILYATNEAKRVFDSWKKLTELQMKVDTLKFDQIDHPVVREFRKLDFTKYNFVHDGMLTWKQGSHQVANIYAVLLDVALVLLTKKGNKLVLKFHGSTLIMDKRSGSTKVLKYCPIVLLNAVEIREDLADSERFFIYEKNAEVPPYELTARTAGERILWLKHLEEQKERFKIKNSNDTSDQMSHSLVVQYDVKTPSNKADHDDSGVTTENDYSIDEKMKLIRKLKRTDGIIFNTLLNKQKYLAEILQTQTDNLEYLLPNTDEEMENSTAKELTVGAITQIDLLTNFMAKSYDVKDDDVNNIDGKIGTISSEALIVPVNLISKYLNFILAATD